MEYNDIVGKRFGSLVVNEYVGSEPYIKRNNYWYKCSCDCGNVSIALRHNLITGHKKSCGCSKRKCGNQSKCWGGCGEISGRFWSHIKKHAINRSLEFKITIQEAWNQFVKQDGKCALTGLPLSVKMVKLKNKAEQSGAWHTEKTASLDRINSKKGYTTNNIQWVHKDVNKMKMDFDESWFKHLCKLVCERT